MSSKEQLKAALAAKDEKDSAAQLEKERLKYEEEERINRLIVSYQQAVEHLHTRITESVEGLGIRVSKKIATVPLGSGDVKTIETVLARGEQSVSFKPRDISKQQDLGNSCVLGTVRIGATILPGYFQFTLCLTSINEDGSGEWLLRHIDENSVANEYIFDNARLYSVLQYLFAS
ncbi:TPA: hypothetical protein ACKP2J_002653 [Serratia marcescens]